MSVTSLLAWLVRLCVVVTWAQTEAYTRQPLCVPKAVLFLGHQVT
jgi:hypothetical protein